MSWKNRLTALLDVVLRVPPVFLLDSIFLIGFNDITKTLTLSDDEDYYVSVENIIGEDTVNFNPSNESSGSSHSFPSSAADGPTMSNFVSVMGYTLSIYVALAVFLLPTTSLLNMYMWLVSIIFLVCSYLLNVSYTEVVISSFDSSSLSLPSQLLQQDWTLWQKLLTNYILQVLLSLAFCFLSSQLYESGKTFRLLPKRVVGVFFLLPIMTSLLPRDLLSSSSLISWLSNINQKEDSPQFQHLDDIVMSWSPVVSVSVAACYVLVNVFLRGKTIVNQILSDIEWARTIIRHYGIYTLAESEWSRLNVPQVLRIFWLTRVTGQAVGMFAKSPPIIDSYLELGSIQIPSNITIYTTAGKTLIVRGCETIIAVLGMTSILSSMSNLIGCLVQGFLAVDDPEDRNIGSVSAILFFILALQTGITGMDPEKRFQRLYRNVCLLFTAILHFIHNMVSPLLNSLSASRNLSWSKHLRALTICLFLIAFPIWFLFYLWRQESTLSTWLLAVSAFSIEVVIKVVISLLIYALFMMDAFRSSLWEPLDDYVYYIKATGSTIEFIFGIFLFFNGAWILIFESGGTIRALMMCIHAYFNIWLQAKQGWQTFMRRRTAVGKINSLKEATPQQLADFQDVCAICYQELATARVTPCNHFFHGVCLRKWLYVQDMCPLCQEVFSVDTNDKKANHPPRNVLDELHPIPIHGEENEEMDRHPSWSGESSSDSDVDHNPQSHST